MSIEYFLFCKKTYTEIINELDNVINAYTTIESITTEALLAGTLGQMHASAFNPSHNKNIFVDRKTHINVLRNICHKKIQQLCCHNFIDDSIDIDCETSQNIRYCSICEYTVQQPL